MISVCVATYNGSRFIQEQLHSILLQLSDNDEVIVSDDGSTDKTVELIESMMDTRIKWAGETGGLGVIKNFERALRAAKGDVIFLSDQDDIWLEGKVDKSVEALDRALMVITDCVVVNENREVLDDSFFILRKSGPGFFKNIFKNSYLGCCMAFKRELLDVALPMPTNAAMHDIWLGNLAATLGDVAFIDDRCLLYRRHGKNHSQTAELSQNSIFKKIHLRLSLLLNLTIRLVQLKRKSIH